MAKRDDEEYRIEKFTKVWQVFEALEGTAFEPVKQSVIERRTGFDTNFVMRALKTLQLHGLAAKNERREWTIGRAAIRIAATIAKHKTL